MPISDRRKFSRINFSVNCSITLEKTAIVLPFQTTLSDISLNGALVLLADEVSDLSGELILLRLQLAGSNIELLLNGFVCHQRDQLLGIKFTTLDIDTISHLKRLIELNLGDSESMHREFSLLIEQHISSNNEQ